MSEVKFCPFIKEDCKKDDCRLYINENCAFCDISNAIIETKESVEELNKTLKSKL